jgi:hypothetical protein
MADDISVENVLRQSIELIARFPVLISYAYMAKRIMWIMRVCSCIRRSLITTQRRTFCT